jgi:two-component system response regulator YesN
MANMNPTYLSMVFKEEVGKTYIKYLTGIRIDKAKYFLSQGMKVYDVSRKVGYNNFRYFCDIFRKTTGMTPSEFKGVKFARDHTNG